MRVNPPRLLADGNIFSGPVRLSFANIFKVGKPSQDGGEGKYGAALLFPVGTDMSVFNTAWTKAARSAFPRNWSPDGQPIGLHIPFHDQAEKAYSANPRAGYTPGAITLSATTKYQPEVVDANMNKIIDEKRVYSGVWAFVTLNTYEYNNRKTGVAFGMRMVMVIADDQTLGGMGGDPKTEFAGVTITAQSNVAAKFEAAAAQTAPPVASVMPQGGYVGHPGNLPVQPLPVASFADSL